MFLWLSQSSATVAATTSAWPKLRIAIFSPSLLKTLSSTSTNLSSVQCVCGKRISRIVDLVVFTLVYRYGPKGLSEQVVFKSCFEAVQRCSVADFGRGRVPEVGGCDTEGSVSKGSQVWCWGWRANLSLRTAAFWAECRAGGGQLNMVGLGRGGIYRWEGGVVVDAGLDREPVEVNEGWGDVLPGLSACENPGSRVLHILKSVQYIVWYTGQDPITIIQAGVYDCMIEGFCHRVGECSVKFVANWIYNMFSNNPIWISRKIAFYSANRKSVDRADCFFTHVNSVRN